MDEQDKLADASQSLDDRVVVDEIAVQVVIKTLNHAGYVMSEKRLPTARLFRTQVTDVWGHIDTEIAKLRASGQLDV